MKYGQALRTMRHREKRDQQLQSGKLYPKGFDISLAEVISEFNLNQDDIKKIGGLTADKEIAHASVGHNVYYRRATIERLFGHAE